MTLPRPGRRSHGPSRQLLLDTVVPVARGRRTPQENPEGNEVVREGAENRDAVPRVASPGRVSKSAGGRPQSSVWEFFLRKGNKAQCRYCDAVVSARPKHTMAPHVLHCAKARSGGISALQVCPELKSSPEYNLLRKEQAGLLFNQKTSERLLFELLLATNAPFSLLDSKAFKDFVRSLNPLFEPFSRYNLTMERIPRYTAVVKQEVQEAIDKEKWISVGIDGWSTRANEGLYGVTVITGGGNEYIYDALNLGAEKASADNLMMALDPIIKRLGPKKVVAIVTDGAANMKKLRELAEASYKHCSGIYCVVHALNLFCLSIFKDSQIEKCFGLCCRIIECFNKSNKLTEILRESNVNLGESTYKLTSIGTTRFSTSYDVLQSLQKNKNGLKVLVRREDISLPEEVKDGVLSELFWEQVETIQIILEPLNIAVKATQKPCLRLSECCFYVIFVLFQTLTLSSLNRAAIGDQTCEHIAACCSKLMGNYLKNEIYYLGLILDLRYRCEFSETKYNAIEERLRDYVFGYGGDLALWKSVKSEYLEFLSRRNNIGVREPMRYWKEDSGFQYLPPFALSILSITSNSMSCERAFSTMGWINSQRRASMTKFNLVSSAMIHRHLTTGCKTTEELNVLEGSTWNEEYNQYIDRQLTRTVGASSLHSRNVIRNLVQQFKGDVGLANFLKINQESKTIRDVSTGPLFAPSAMSLFE